MPLTRRELLLATVGQGQETFRSEANLVLVRFSAMRGRNFITDLTAEDVVVAENGQPQKIALFEGPLSAWQVNQTIDFRVMVDLSGTAMPFRPLTGELLRRTLVGTFGRRAVVSIYGFAYDCRRLAGPTQDASEIAAGLGRLETVDVRQLRRSASRIFDSVVEVAREIDADNEGTHPVLLVFSDGLNSGNHLNLDDAVKAALGTGFVVYPVLLANPGERSTREAELIEEYAKLGEQTGGRSFWPAAFTEESLSRILVHIVNEVRAEYTVGYYRGSGDRGVRTASVKLKERRKGNLKGGVRLVGK